MTARWDRAVRKTLARHVGGLLRAGLVAAALAAAGCGGGAGVRTGPVLQPGAGRIVLAPPGAEARADTIPLAARRNVGEAARELIARRGHEVVLYQKGGAAGDRGRQLILLHEAVADTLLAAEEGALELIIDTEYLATRTLGVGARSLGQAYGADYAVLLSLRGKSGRAARASSPVNVGGLPPGDVKGAQDLAISLVNLTTGDLVWFKSAKVDLRRDYRLPEAASAAMEKLLQEIPL